MPASDTQKQLLLLIEELEKKPIRKDLVWLGEQLGRIINRQRPFSYRYLHSVLSGSLEAGRPLRRAINTALLHSDGVPVMQVEAKEQTVLSNKEIDGMFVLGNIKTCASAECLVQFVDNHPARKYCPFCRPPERR